MNQMCNLTCLFIVIFTLLFTQCESTKMETFFTTGEQQIATGNCTDTYCNYNGNCNDAKTACICTNGYITFISTDGTECNYKQKNPILAFCLELFLGIPAGAGYFYIGQIGLAVGQLILFWVGIVFVCLIACCGVFTKGGGDTVIVIVFAAMYLCLFIGGVFAWWVYALVIIGQGYALDGNGAAVPQL